MRILRTILRAFGVHVHVWREIHPCCPGAHACTCSPIPAAALPGIVRARIVRRPVASLYDVVEECACGRRRARSIYAGNLLDEAIWEAR